MDDLISRQVAMDELKKTVAVNKNPNHDARIWEEGMNCAITIIGALPLADAVEVRHGCFIGTEYDGFADGNPVYYEWKCSECGCIFEDEEPTYNYCPSCGARMDGGT